MNATINTTVPAATAFTLHGVGTSLTPAAGEHVLTVKGDPKSGRSGATFKAPLFAAAEVMDWAETRPAIQALIANIAAQAQRDLCREFIANGGAGSIPASQLNADAVIAYLCSAGASAVRLTKEVLGRMRAPFALAVAARWSEVKGAIADTMTQEEVLLASRPVFDSYWPILEAATKDGALVPVKEGGAILRCLACLDVLLGAEDVAESAPELLELKPAFAALRSRIVSGIERSEKLAGAGLDDM